MTTIGPIAIAEDGNDCEIDEGRALYVSGESGSEGFIGRYTSVYIYGSFRFQLPSAIPTGSTIGAGTKIEIYGTSTWSWGASYYAEIYAQQSSNAGQQSGTAVPTLTSTSVRWPASGGLTWSTSAWNERDITAIIQELIDDYGGLESSAYITILVRGNSSFTDGEIGFEDYSHASTHHARLTIVYSSSNPTVSIIETLSFAEALD
jgi:hypothetical protein